MNKKEFIEILKNSLIGEVSTEVLDQNIAYYNQYISSKSGTEEERIIHELGDPRLIAKTIIESNRAAKQKGKYTGQHNHYEDYHTDQNGADMNQHRSDRDKGLYSELKWYHKAIIYSIIILVIVILLFVFYSIAKLLIIFAIPLLLMMLLFGLFRRR
jgi:uncharacterized membrane protein